MKTLFGILLALCVQNVAADQNLGAHPQNCDHHSSSTPMSKDCPMPGKNGGGIYHGDTSTIVGKDGHGIYHGDTSTIVGKDGHGIYHGDTSTIVGKDGHGIRKIFPSNQTPATPATPA